MKKLIVLLIVLLCVNVVVAVNEYCLEDTESDAMNGEPIYDEVGTVTTNQGTIYDDACDNNNYIRDYYCEAGLVVYEQYDCRNEYGSCYLGRCVECRNDNVCDGVCVDYECVECEVDGDCADGYTCESNVCEAEPEVAGHAAGDLSPGAFADGTYTFSNTVTTSSPALSVISTESMSTGVYAQSDAFYGVYGYSPNYAAVVGGSVSSMGLWGYSSSYYGVYGSSSSSYGVYGYSSTSNGVYGETDGTGQYRGGVKGKGYGDASGVYGNSEDGYGIFGYSTESNGVYGKSVNGDGVYGRGANVGVYGHGDSVGGAFETGGDYGVYVDMSGADTTSYGVFVDEGAFAGVYAKGTTGVFGYSDSTDTLECGLQGFNSYNGGATGYIGCKNYGAYIEGLAYGTYTEGNTYGLKAVRLDSGNGCAIQAEHDVSGVSANLGCNSYGLKTDDDIYVGNCAHGCDVAEAFDGDTSLEPGDVVVIDPSNTKSMMLSTKEYDTTVAGVVSTKPTIIMGGAEDRIPLALAGVVPTKVTAENGAIKIGDLLTTSSTSGHAMKCKDANKCAGALIGKALEPLDKGKGEIIVLVALS